MIETFAGEIGTLGEVRTDPHVGKNDKSAQFDNEYERMMNDRKMIDTNNVAGAVR